MKNDTDFVQYLHANAFSSVKSTWDNEIQKGYYRSCLVLTLQLFNTYLPNSEATSRGHIDQVLKNNRSTRL